MNYKKNIDILNCVILYIFFIAPLIFQPDTLQDRPLLKDLFVCGTKPTQWIPVPVMLCHGSAGSLTQMKREININEPEKNITKKWHPC